MRQRSAESVVRLVVTRYRSFDIADHTEARTKPADLASMVDLVFGDVEPRPVRIQRGRNAQRRLEPRVIARRQRGTRRLARPSKLIKIELQLVTAYLVAPLLARLQGRGPRVVFRSRRLALLERHELIAALHRRNVCEQAPMLLLRSSCR